MTLESLARTIAKARHGTDAMWAKYMGAAEAVVNDLALAASADIEWEAYHWLNYIIAPARRAIIPTHQEPR